MKTLLYTFILSGALAFCAACTTSQTSADATQKKGPDYANYNNLADVLRRQGGVQVVGTGDNVKVYIRGMGSIVLNTQPLYVIDGVPMGNDYKLANGAITPRNITSVRILRDQSQITSYGEQGNHGVILIKTNSKKEDL